MQIGDKLYVDIEIDSIGFNRSNFLGPLDLIDLQVIETAGASLPIVYVSFITHDQEIANYFIPNNEIIVKIGESEDKADSLPVQIYALGNPANDNMGGTWTIEFAGFASSSRYALPNKYMVNYETKSYYGNSALVAFQVLYDYFGAKPAKGLSTTITRTNENQVVWRRNNQSACTFLAETLVHMDITPSFPLFSFDRYGTFYLRDFDSTIKEEPKVYFTTQKPTRANEIQYFNNFTVESFKDMYNLYSGFNKVTEIYGAKTGIPQYTISANEPILAATKESEKIESASRSAYNLIQSPNVHNTYISAFVYNTNKLMALSSMSGALQLVGSYYKNFKPTDLVNVSTDGDDKVLNGPYLIDSIVTQADMAAGNWRTYVYVTRDNKNSVENYIANPQRGIKIKKKFWTDLANAVSRLRVAYATGLKIIDGTYMKNVLSFATACKTNLLRSFVVAGVTIDFTSSANLIESLINTGNSLMNTLLAMIFPDQIAGVFRDFIIRKPSLRALLSNYIAQYVPYELQDIISAIVDALYHTTNSLNSIAKDNGINVATGTTTVSAPSLVGDQTVTDTTDTSESQKLVNNIITDFENNTSGLSIPFPIIELTESQSLMSEPLLRDYVANQTIANLTNLGYLEGVDIDKFKEILLGEEPIDFNMIDQINKNAGNSYNYRLWGTYNDLTELTSFFIKKSYKDKYRTIPCTKLINATDNIKIFFACPEKEADLRFYINSKRVELPKFNIQLGYTDAYGNPIEYVVYYTENGFNSTSVLFEVKQGGMV